MGALHTIPNPTCIWLCYYCLFQIYPIVEIWPTLRAISRVFKSSQLKWLAGFSCGMTSPLSHRRNPRTLRGPFTVRMPSKASGRVLEATACLCWGSTLPRSVAQRAAWPAGSLWSQGAGGTGWSDSSPSAPPCTSPARERETEGEGVVGQALIHHLREGELLI